MRIFSWPLLPRLLCSDYFQKYPLRRSLDPTRLSPIWIPTPLLELLEVEGLLALHHTPPQPGTDRMSRHQQQYLLGMLFVQKHQMSNIQIKLYKQKCYASQT